MEMMCMMHEAEHYGHLEIGGKSQTNADLIKRFSGQFAVHGNHVRALLNELEDNGVFSRTDDGTIYCRRMVRDEHIRQVRAAAGAKGAAAVAGRLPDNLPQQNGQQKSGSSSRAPAQSSSSSSVNNSLPLSTPQIEPAPEPHRNGTPSLPDIPAVNGMDPVAFEERRTTQKRRLAEMAAATPATGPPENGEDG